MISYGRRFARLAGGFLCLVTLLSLVQILPVHGNAKCVNSNKAIENAKSPDWLAPNNYAKKTMKWGMAASASRIITGATGNSETCPIGVDSVNSTNLDTPATSCSAIISTHIGDYIAYCAQEPSNKILSYELNCNRGVQTTVLGSIPLITETLNPVFHLEPVDDMVSTERPRQLLIALSRDAFSSAFEVLTDNNFFSLSPCRHVFEYKHLAAVATMPIYEIGTVIAFANNNPDVNAPHNQRLAPVYVARAGVIQFCGLANVEHTTDVTLWYREDKMMVTFIEMIGRSRRCLIRNFELVFDEHHECQDVVPWNDQPTIGNSIFNGTTEPLAMATEAFTIDHFLCGCQAIQAVQNESLTYLVVGLANTAPAHDGGLSCLDQEKMSFNNSATDHICACPFSQNVSFVIPYNKTTKTFNHNNHYDNSTFQILEKGPDEVTEITPLLLKDCCLAFQVTSDRNDTRLYTVDIASVNGHSKPRVDHFLNIDLPPYVEKTAWGYCSDDTIFMSYTREGFITGNSIFKLQCKMDDFVDFGYLRSQSYNSPPSAPSYSQRQDGRLSYGMENQDAPQPQRYPGKTGPTETYQRPESEYVPQQAYGAPQQPQQYNSPRNASAYPSQGAGIPAQQYNGPQMTLYSPPPPPPPPPNYGPPAGYQGPPNSNVPLPQPLPGGAIMVNPFNQTGRVYGRKRK